jgi:CBS domain-containing protein
MFEIPYLLSKFTVDRLMKPNVITVTEDTPLEAVSLFVDAIQQADVRAIIQD